MSGFADRWLDTVVRVERKPSVYRLYESILRNWIVPYFGDTDLTEITPMRVEEFRAWCVGRDQLAEATDAKGRKRPMSGRTRSAKTVNEVIGVLSSMLTKAVRWRYIPANPCAGVERLKLPPQEFQFYTAEQSTLWLDTCKRVAPAWYALFFTGFRSGLREGEMFGLEWTDVDFALRRIHVRRSISRGSVVGPDGKRTSAYIVTLPKSNKARTVEMSRQLAEVLTAHRHLRGPLVFCDEEGNALTRERLMYPWARVTKAAGLPLLRPHDMRHSFASQLVMAGVPLRRVQDLLGHSTIRMTERYAHLAPSTDTSVADLLDQEMDTAMGTGPVSIPTRRVITPTSVVGAAGFEPDGKRRGKRR